MKGFTKLISNNSKPETYFSYVLDVFTKIGALRPIFDRKEFKYKVINIFYSLLLDSLLIHMSILCLYDIFHNWTEDVSKAIYNLSSVIIYGGGCFILVYFQLTNERLIEMFDFVRIHFRFRSARGMSVVTIQSHIASARHMFYAVTVVTLLAASQWVLDPILLNTSKSDFRHLPLDLWYAEDVQESPLYEIAYMLQSLSQIAVAITYVSIAGSYMSFAMLLSGQYAILCSNIRNVCHTGALRAGVPYNVLASTDSSLLHDQHWDEGVEVFDCDYDCKDGEEYKVQKNLEQDCDPAFDYDPADGIDFSLYEEEAMFSIRESVQHHILLLRFYDMQLTYFSLPLVIEFISAVISTTSALYSSLEKFEIKTFGYIIAPMAHLLGFCVTGSIVSTQNEQLRGATWEAAWWAGGRLVSGALLIIANQAEHVIMYKAGPFFELNVATFATTCKMTFSVLALLQSMK